MSKYTQSSGAQGAWIDKEKLTTGMKAVIASEVEPVAGEFEGKPNMRDIGKLSVGGGEEQNFAFNKTTLNALVEAFGEESNEWQGESVTIHMKESIIGGREVLIAYLIPDGFELGKDENKRLVIRRKDEIPVIEEG